MDRTQSRVATVAVAPVALLVAFVWHPYLPGRQPNIAAIATAVSTDPTRWALSHLATIVGAMLLILALLAIDGYVRDLGEERWRGPGVALMIVGTALYAVLPALELGPWAAAQAGGDVQATAALVPWFVPIIVVAALTSMLGAMLVGRGLRQTRFMSPRTARVVAAGLLVMTAARFVPFSAVQFYVQGLAAVITLWTLAYAMRTHPEHDRAVELRGQPRSVDPRPTV